MPRLRDVPADDNFRWLCGCQGKVIAPYLPTAIRVRVLTPCRAHVDPKYRAAGVEANFHDEQVIYDPLAFLAEQSFK